MSRSREQIMQEWDDVRARIASGCGHSGPRDWLEGVLDEQDKIIAHLVRRLAAQPTISVPFPNLMPSDPSRMPICGCQVGSVCMSTACPHAPKITCRTEVTS